MDARCGRIGSASADDPCRARHKRRSCEERNEANTCREQLYFPVRTEPVAGRRDVPAVQDDPSSVDASWHDSSPITRRAAGPATARSQRATGTNGRHRRSRDSRQHAKAATAKAPAPKAAAAPKAPPKHRQRLRTGQHPRLPPRSCRPPKTARRAKQAAPATDVQRTGAPPPPPKARPPPRPAERRRCCAAPPPPSPRTCRPR